MSAASSGSVTTSSPPFTSNGTGRLSNYVDGTGLVGAEIAAGLDAAIGQGGFTLGLAASYRYGGAADITAHDGDRAVVLGVRSHDVEALALAGYRGAALGGWSIGVQAGARLVLDLVDQDYAITVPSERILALQVGAGIELPRIVAGLGLAASAAFLPVGERAQTEHLGEGESAATNGFSIAATLTYAVSPVVCLFLAGRYARISTRFDGPAERDPAITSASRDTTLGSISLGVRLQRY